MRLNRHSILGLTMIASVSLFGCGDDDPVSPGDPEDPRIESVVVSPESVTLAGVGEDVQFDAAAYDQYGAEVDTVYAWESSNAGVVTIGPNGVAVATGFGTAEIYAMTAGIADTADVTVTPGVGPVIEWIAGGDGNWEEGANWSGGTAPGDGDIAIINAAGTYTVTLNGNVTVEALVLGNESGNQTLDTQSHQLITTTGGLKGGAELVVDGELRLLGDFAWSGGNVTGSGTVELESGSELNVVGNPLELVVALNNSGTIALRAGSTLRVNELLDSKPGALVELQGDAIMTVQNNGNFNSTGTIRKSLGEAEASIFASSAEFHSSGWLLVEAGSLVISGGSLSGFIRIDADAMLRQSGSTQIRSANSEGDGPLVIGGRVDLGFYENQIITFRHIVLDSGSIPAVSGMASLLVDHAFVWRRGTVHELRSLNTQIGSQTTFENGGSKVLSATTWNIIGNVAGNSDVDLSLANGGLISLESAGRWMQTSGGTITQGPGDAGRFDVIGEFHKTGEGAFVVETPFTCSGTLDLREGVLTVQGDFSLFDSGVITGGGTGDPYMNRRLILVDAPSAVMRGTIRPDLDGQPARLDIQGLVDLESTCRIELDVVTDGPIDTESVNFLTSGQVYGGTLALNVMQPPSAGAEYRVIYANRATGDFVDITGGGSFLDIVVDETGVLCRR